MSNLKLFENSVFGNVRVCIAENGNPYFCLSDVCNCLDLSNPSKVKSQLDTPALTNSEVSHIIMLDVFDGTQNRSMTFIDEPNLYKCIFQSRKENAIEFQNWVCYVVLPSIRKNGGYLMNQETLSPEQIVANALVVAQSIINEQKQQLETANKQILEDKPKVDFYDRVGNTDRSISVGEFAKIIFDTKNLKIGQNRLFKALREMGYLNSKKGKQYNLPKQTYMDKGWFEVVEYTLNIGDEVIPKPQTRITGKGQTVLVDKILSFVNNQRA